MDGKVERLKNGNIQVTVLDEPWSLEFGATQEGNFYKRTFSQRKLFLPEEETKFKSYVELDKPGKFWITMNGFSNTSKFLEKYGLQPGSYERACARLFAKVIKMLRERFPTIEIATVYGVSNVGIDLAIMDACSMTRPAISIAGVTCPRFLLYAEDDPQWGPVYVAATKQDYADRYVKWADLLISTGGCEHALEHDIKCAVQSLTKIYFINILKLLCPNTNDSGIEVVDGKVKIINAPAVFGSSVAFFDATPITRFADIGLDLFQQAEMAVGNFTIEVARQLLPPEVAY